MKKNETAGTSLQTSAGTSLQTCTPISASLTHEQGADVAFPRYVNIEYKFGDLNQQDHELPTFQRQNPRPLKGSTWLNKARFFFSIKRQVSALFDNILPFRGRGFWLTSTILRSMFKSKSGPARVSETRENWFKYGDLNQHIQRNHWISQIALFLFFTLISSCTPTEKPYHPSPESHDPQIVHDLSQALTDVIVHDVFSPPVAARIYAYTHLAAYEALRWDKGTYPSLTAQLRGFSKIPEPQDDGAIHCFPLVAAHAFVGVSKMLVFSDTMLERKVRPVFQKLANLHLPKAVEARSIAYADKIVAAIAERIKSDNYKETRGFSRYTPKTAAGNWEQTPPDYMDAIEPHWRKILPFILDSASQFKPIRPAPYSKDPASPFFKDMMFVYTTSQTLTEEQKAIANFWDCNPFVTHNEGHLMFATKKITPGGHWMGIARIACLKTKADLFKSAQTYALTAVTMNDAFISCWDEKYRSEYVRPETAIRNLKDPKWFPLLQTPPFPEYTSGHSVVSSASAVVLTKLYGDSFAYVDSVEVNYGLPPRSFDSFAAAASEASRSRLYGGIHFLPAIENGVKQGKAVGLFIVHTIITQ